MHQIQHGSVLARSTYQSSCSAGLVRPKFPGAVTDCERLPNLTEPSGIPIGLAHGPQLAVAMHGSAAGLVVYAPYPSYKTTDLSDVVERRNYLK